MGCAHTLDTSTVLAMLDDLERFFRGFPWESIVWKRDGLRRSPYRALILFGLSARTNDRLLAQMCTDFFERFPKADHLKNGWLSGDSQGIVRAGQKPFIDSVVNVIGEDRGVIPRDRETLKRIKGVGDKVAECVIAYGWGEEALPLDGHCCRVLERVVGLDRGSPVGILREQLKNIYFDQRPWMSERDLALVDLHELIRLHGQTTCSRTPKCSLCPVSICRSRRAEYQPDSAPMVAPDLWKEWRELLLEPEVVNGLRI